MKKAQTKVQEQDQERKQYLADLIFHGHLKVTVRVVVLVLLPLILCGGGGYILDRYMGTSPLLTIIGVALAFALSQALTVVVIKRLTEKK